MIEHLKTGLSARTKLPQVDGMTRVSFQFFGQTHLHKALLAVVHYLGFTLHHPDQQAASRAAHRAEAGLTRRHPGNEIFVGDEADELVVRAAAGIERGHDARERGYFYKVTTLHGVPKPCLQG